MQIGSGAASIDMKSSTAYSHSVLACIKENCTSESPLCVVLVRQLDLSQAASADLDPMQSTSVWLNGDGIEPGCQYMLRLHTEDMQLLDEIPIRTCTEAAPESNSLPCR